MIYLYLLDVISGTVVSIYQDPGYSKNLINSDFLMSSVVVVVVPSSRGPAYSGPIL